MGEAGPRFYRAKLDCGAIVSQAIAEVWPAEGRLRLFRLQAPPWDHWLSIRRSIPDPAGMVFYVTFGPDKTDLSELAAVAGLRWTIEECFQSAKGETGRAHCESPSWHAWHWHMPLSMLALAFFVGLRAWLKEAQISIASTNPNKRSLSAAA